MCDLSVAVANALPAVKDTADFVTTSDHGHGVSQLMEKVVADDMADCDIHLHRHFLTLGTHGDQAVSVSPHGRSVLICGPSASGKSTIATRFVEALQERKHQFCLIDPEGDYEGLEGAVAFGGPRLMPSEVEILRLLEDTEANAVVCLTGMQISDRPQFFLKLLSRLLQMRSRTGHPQWLILDEAHHLLPADWVPPEGTLPPELNNVVLITVHPELLSTSLLSKVGTVLALGETAAKTLDTFAKSAGHVPPSAESAAPGVGEFLIWSCDRDDNPITARAQQCKMDRLRHRRKYAAGELPPDRSFYFTGAAGKMNLRAQNLMLFLQLADGIDDATWDFHLHRHDYSKWFREGIKDDNLADQAADIESRKSVTPQESRALIRAAVEQDYTLPAAPPLAVPGAG